MMEEQKTDNLECIYCGSDKNLEEVKTKSICITCLKDIKEIK